MAYEVTTLNSVAGVRPVFAGLSWKRVMTMVAVYQERAALASMDAERLADLGLTREEARREAQRPFWDLPAGR